MMKAGCRALSFNENDETAFCVQVDAFNFPTEPEYTDDEGVVPRTKRPRTSSAASSQAAGALLCISSVYIIMLDQGQLPAESHRQAFQALRHCGVRHCRCLAVCLAVLRNYCRGYYIEKGLNQGQVHKVVKFGSNQWLLNPVAPHAKHSQTSAAGTSGAAGG